MAEPQRAIQDIRWLLSPLAPGDVIGLPWLSPVAQRVLWVALVIFAGVDVFHPVSALHESWWITFFVLSALRSRELVEPLAFWGRLALWLSAIGLFSWLVERLQIAMIYSTRTSLLFPSSPSLRPLTYPVCILIWSTVIGVVILAMLRRTVGAAAAVPIGVLACIPLECQFLNFLFEPSTEPLVFAIRLFQVMMPVLMVAEAGSLFERMTAPASFVETKRGIARLLRAILDGGGGLIASGGLYAGGGVVLVTIMRSWNRSSGEARLWIWVTLHLAVFVLSLFAVIGAGVATWWKLGRMSQQPTGVSPLAILGKLIVAGSAAVLFVFLMFTMPRISHVVTRALRGREWSVHLTHRPGGLRVQGAIQMGISHEFAALVIRNPSVHVVDLASPGGNVGEATAMAAIVKDYELSTYVEPHRECDSACALVFVAGRSRHLGKGARLGFHREKYVFWDDRGDDERANERLEAYLTANGVAASFARKAVSVPASRIWYPSRKTLIAAGVLTGATQKTYWTTIGLHVKSENRTLYRVLSSSMQRPLL